MDTGHNTSVEKPWHANFPPQKSTVDSVSREELLQMLQDESKVPGRDFLTIDLRRTDHEVCHVMIEICLPGDADAQDPCRAAPFAAL